MALNPNMLSKVMLGKLKTKDSIPDQQKKLCDTIASCVIQHLRMFAQFSVVIPLTTTGSGTGSVIGAGGGVPGPVAGVATTAVVGISMGIQPPASGWFS